MKQPYAPREILVWTPDMDPRQKIKSAAPTPLVSAPSIRVIKPASPEKPVPKPVPLPTAEMPPTRLKTPSPNPPATSAVQKEEKPTPTPKEQKRQEVLKLAAEHGILEDHAFLVQSGKWTLEDALNRKRDKKRSQTRLAGMARSESLLREWIDQKTDLLRWTQKGPIAGHLLQLDTCQWLWDDQPEPQLKLETFAILPQIDLPHWTPWQIDAEREAQNLEVPKLFEDRLRIAPWRLEYAQETQPVCLVKFYNGLEIQGYLAFWHDHIIELVKSLEPDSPRILVLRHAISQFLILPKQAATPSSEPQNSDGLGKTEQPL